MSPKFVLQYSSELLMELSLEYSESQRQQYNSVRYTRMRRPGVFTHANCSEVARQFTKFKTSIFLDLI